MPDAGVLATILLIAGLFLLALELMIPSFGIIGICSAITLLVSAWCAWQAWWGTSPGFFWTYVSFWLLGIPLVFVGMLAVMQYTSLGDSVVLRGPRSEAATVKKRQQRGLDTLIGQTGKALSLLTPGGMVMIGGERFHAESPGMLIEPGTRVQVVSVKATRLVVRTAPADTLVPPASAETAVETVAPAESVAATEPAVEPEPVTEPEPAAETQAVPESPSAAELAQTVVPPADSSGQDADTDQKSQTDQATATRPNATPDRTAAAARPASSAQAGNGSPKDDILDFEVPENYTAG